MKDNEPLTPEEAKDKEVVEFAINHAKGKGVGKRSNARNRRKDTTGLQKPKEL
jgi:hypothetical protein